MSQLTDLQSQVREAVVRGAFDAVRVPLVGGRNPRQRLEIHRRHYETSLVTALLTKFPATVWLVGSAFTTEAARQFAREQPPRRPCIAEYGDGFPRFLATRPTASGVPYLGAFAELEWHVGQVSIAIERPPVPMADWALLDPEALADAVVTLQPGAPSSPACRGTHRQRSCRDRGA